MVQYYCKNVQLWCNIIARTFNYGAIILQERLIMVPNGYIDKRNVIQYTGTRK